MSKKNISTLFAILAAAFYAINVPISKILMQYVEPTMMASFLYLGAGIGLLLYSSICTVFFKVQPIKEPLTKRELPYTITMVVLDIIAPILLMFGITQTNSANVSLLNNFEIVATSLVAYFIFKEIISKRLFIAIVLITLSSIILSFESIEGFTFNIGSILVLGASICWGFENNCTKMLSSKSSIEIVTIKGCFSGLGSLVIALISNEKIPTLKYLIMVIILGFISYGLSINFYIIAQKELGAMKTSAYYSIAPFLGVAFSILLLNEAPTLQFFVALIIMVISTVIMVKDNITLQHTHEHQHIHTHEHRHGDIVHTHEHIHTHTHIHIHDENDTVHLHKHNDSDLIDHNHLHIKV